MMLPAGRSSPSQQHEAPMATAIATALLGKLREIDKAIERGETTVIRPMVLDAEDCVLQMERELMTLLVETERLRRAA